jgi:protein gp37
MEGDDRGLQRTDRESSGSTEYQAGESHGGAASKQAQFSKKRTGRMSQNSPIQWTDDTVNPVMGCSAPCELRPSPGQVLTCAQNFFKKQFPEAKPKDIEKMVRDRAENHNATELYQLREDIVADVIEAVDGKPRVDEAVKIMAKALKDEFDRIFICYAHQQHLMRGSDITNPDKRTNPGYARQFEIVTEYPGRVADAAMKSDLCGTAHKKKPWLDFLPRMIFVSDMADALSERIDFSYLKKEIVDVAASTRGSQHIWLWLTKMPKRMAEFGQWLPSQGSRWPDNLVAMTSVTSTKTITRAHLLKAVPSRFKGLSVEPLWEDVTLPLEGIDWCIVGGQSGHGSKPFDLAWAENLIEQCKASGTAFFMKQLGAEPMADGKRIELPDAHGGEWAEWPAHLRIREMPRGFRSLRFAAMH